MEFRSSEVLEYCEQSVWAADHFLIGVHLRLICFLIRVHS